MLFIKLQEQEISFVIVRSWPWCDYVYCGARQQYPVRPGNVAQHASNSKPTIIFVSVVIANGRLANKTQWTRQAKHFAGIKSYGFCHFSSDH